VPTYRDPISPSEHYACPRCRNGEFWLRPDGAIICADDDCHAAFMRWVTYEAAEVIADLALAKALSTASCENRQP
jgi:hypothetical protein